MRRELNDVMITLRAAREAVNRYLKVRHEAIVAHPNRQRVSVAPGENNMRELVLEELLRFHSDYFRPGNENDARVATVMREEIGLMKSLDIEGA